MVNNCTAGWVAGSMLVALGILGPVPSVRAQEMPVPSKLQAALFQKIFTYDKSLRAKGTVSILIVAAEPSGKTASDLRAAFGSVGGKAEVVPESGLAAGVTSADVVYVLANRVPSDLAKLSANHSVLTVSGVPELVEKGQVAVALGIEGGKPKILVHRARLQADGHQLSAHILRLARIVD